MSDTWDIANVVSEGPILEVQVQNVLNEAPKTVLQTPLLTTFCDHGIKFMTVDNDGRTETCTFAASWHMCYP